MTDNKEIELEDTEGFLITSTIAYSTGNDKWADEFIEWYEPRHWLNSRRAACAFLSNKITAQVDILVRSLKEAGLFLEEICNAVGKYPDLNEKQVVADAYAELSKINTALERVDNMRGE